MTKPSRVVFLFVIILGSLTGCQRSFAPSETINVYLENKENPVSTYYFYPSTVRMLGTILSGSGITALSEIRQGRLLVFSPDEESTELISAFPELKTQAEAEGFELLISMKRDGTKIDAYMNNSDIPTYLLFFEESMNPFVVEVIGHLSMSSINELATLDLNKANDIFDLLPEQEEEATDTTDMEQGIEPTDSSNTVQIKISL